MSPMGIYEVICQDHKHCATCGQLLIGWHCWQDTEGNYFCTADCWIGQPQEED